jgi:hypothetical protein
LARTKPANWPSFAPSSSAIDEQIGRGECSEYDENTLDGLFEEVEREGLRTLANEQGNTE